MKYDVGDIRLNPYGYYLSWEINMGKPVYPEIWGGNTSLLYNICHYTIEMALGVRILTWKDSYLKAYRWSAYDLSLCSLLACTESAWHDLFDFFSVRNLRFLITFRRGYLGVIALNVTDKDRLYQKTLRPDERENIGHLLKAIYKKSIGQ
jgi:hypothetical protein